MLARDVLDIKETCVAEGALFGEEAIDGDNDGLPFEYTVFISE